MERVAVINTNELSVNLIFLLHKGHVYKVLCGILGVWSVFLDAPFINAFMQVDKC